MSRDRFEISSDNILESLLDNRADNSDVIRFLDHYSMYASAGHLLAVQALQDAINRATDSAEQKLLSVKVLTEFGAAMEDLGALCIAIRHCKEEMGLIHAYLTYGKPGPFTPNTTIPKMFELLKDGNGLVDGLDLPPLNNLLANDPELRNSIVPALYIETNKLLEQVGTAYFHDGKAVVRVYNKTKHGFVVIDDPNLFTDKPPDIQKSITYIVTDNPAFKDKDAEGISPIELHSMTVEDVDPLIDRIIIIRGAVVALCGLIVYLLTHNMIDATFHTAQPPE